MQFLLDFEKREYTLKSSDKDIQFGKLSSKTFSVTLEKDSVTGYYTAQCVELPAAISQGKTEEEARDNIREAIDLFWNI